MQTVETLAVSVSGLAAPGMDYDRIAADISAIRSALPSESLLRVNDIGVPVLLMKSEIP